MLHTSERPPEIERLRAETRGLKYRPAKRKPPAPDPADIRYLFTVEDGNRWMELGMRQPEAKMLFGEFWHQHEICILFADTNTGKSVLAVQIAESIARARAIDPFTSYAQPAKVLYIDFELTTNQFYQRYSHQQLPAATSNPTLATHYPQLNYEFSPNFYRASFNQVADIPQGIAAYNDHLLAGIEYKLQQIKATVLIIDNISCLQGGTESALVALRLMSSLKELKARHRLSILVLAHTPKRRNTTRPISTDDLHGSKLLINFADSAFAIGKSTADATSCYLKQIKQRNTQPVYHEGNILLGRITQPGNWLHFTFESTAPERNHLQTPTRQYREQLAQQVNKLYATGITQREIATQLNISLGVVNKYIKADNIKE